jgi:hypothetical protein
MYGLKPVPFKDAELSPSTDTETDPSLGLFEEFGEAVEVLAEFAEFPGEDGDFGFELGHALFEVFGFFGTQRCGVRRSRGVGVRCGFGVTMRWGGFEGFYVSGEEVGEAGLFGAWLAREDFDQRFGFAGDETLEDGLDVAKLVEFIHALGAGAEFAGGLRAAQEKDADYGDFAAGEVEDFLDAVLVLGNAGVSADGAGEALGFEAVEGLADFGFVERGDRVAVVLLIAGVDQGVEGERVVLGGGDFFFDEGAEDAGFSWGELHGFSSQHLRRFAGLPCGEQSKAPRGSEGSPKPVLRQTSQRTATFLAYWYLYA